MSAIACKIHDHPKPVNNLARHSPTTNWPRGTIFAAAFFRIHKPVQNMCLYSPAKPQGSDEPLVHQMTEISHFVSHCLQYPRIVPRRTGREEPFLLPPFSESTTIPSQFRTFLCIVPQNPKAAMIRHLSRKHSQTCYFPNRHAFCWVLQREFRQPAATRALPRGVRERCSRRGLILSHLQISNRAPCLCRPALKARKGLDPSA